MSCPYRFIFGIPGEGFHSARFLGLALNDTSGTILIGIAIAYFFHLSVWKTVFVLFVLGEVLHYLFGVQTAFLTMLNIRAC
jgi:hypothetical protein